MENSSNWFLNHLKLLLAIVVFGVTAAIVGVVMYKSYSSYQDYEKKFDENDLAVRSLSPAEPKRIEIEDDFTLYDGNGNIKVTKSTYAKQFTAWAEDLEVSSSNEEKIVNGSSLLDTYIPNLDKGGTISLSLTIEEKAFVDIDFVISSSLETEGEDGTIYGVKDLLNNVTFLVNGETMEETIDLENDGSGVNWHHLVMAGFALPAGDITIEIKNQSGKNKMMPEVRNISVFSSETLTKKATE